MFLYLTCCLHAAAKCAVLPLPESDPQDVERHGSEADGIFLHGGRYQQHSDPQPWWGLPLGLRDWEHINTHWCGLLCSLYGRKEKQQIKHVWMVTVRWRVSFPSWGVPILYWNESLFYFIIIIILFFLSVPVRVHPWMSHQFIAGPYVSIWGSRNLLKGTSEVLPYYQNYFHVINNNDTNNIVLVIDVS